MESDKKPAESASGAAPAPEQSVPKDALERTNEDLGAEAPASTPADAVGPDGKPPKKPSAIKQFFKRFNVYLLLFVLVVVIAGIVTTVGYLNGKKTPKAPSIANQTLDQDTLKQLANSDATVGDTGQTLTVQGNAIFSGQVLIRSNLNVAGTIQLGSAFTVPQLTVSNTANLASTQISTLQVAQDATLQGTVTVQNSLNVGGAASFSGPVTAGQITVTRLIMSGNATLEVPNHLGFPGASPSRSINQGVLGVGGSASVNGSDTTGTVNVNSGSSPTTGCFITITFNKAFTGSPHVLITPVGAAAGQNQFYVNRSNTSFSICQAAPAPANQVFAYDYFVTD